MKDRNDVELEEGDIVNIPCRVTYIDSAKPEWNNVNCTAMEPNHPGQYHTEFHVNSMQLEFVSREAKPAVAALVAVEDVLEEEQRQQHDADDQV